MTLYFVSHASANYGPVLAAVEELKPGGPEFWIAPRDIPDGEDSYEEHIIEALDNCDKVILIATEDSIRSDGVLKELRIAQKNGKRIIPVHVSGELQGRIRWYTDGPRVFPSTWENLAQTIGAAIGEAPTAPAVTSPTPATDPSPRRTLYSRINRPSLPVLNAVYDNPVYGNENQFLSAKASNDGEDSWDDPITVEGECLIDVRLYVANSAKTGSESILGARAGIGWTSTADGQLTLHSLLSTRNGNPAQIFDTLTVRTTGQMQARFVPRSGRLVTRFHRSPLPDSIWSQQGATIGSCELDGTIPPGRDFQILVLAQVRLVY